MWDVFCLWVFDMFFCVLVGYYDNLGDILDISMVGYEIFVLQRGGERFLMKLILIFKLVNFLFDVLEFLECSYKNEEQENEK